MSPTSTASSTSAASTRVSETATSTPQASVNSHSLLRVVDAGHDPSHRELGLAPATTPRGSPCRRRSPTMTTSNVVEPWRSRGSPARTRRPSSHSASTGSRASTYGAGSLSMSSTSWLVVQQFAGDRAADRAGSGDGDAHAQDPPSGDVLATSRSNGVLRIGRSGRASCRPSCINVEDRWQLAHSEPGDVGRCGSRSPPRTPTSERPTQPSSCGET